MKKIVFVLLFIMAVSVGHAASPRLDYGVLGEVNQSRFLMSNVDDINGFNGKGMSLGGFAKINLSRHVTLQPEMLLVWQSSSYIYGACEHEYKFFGVEVPLYVLAQFHLSAGDKLFAGIGPYGRLGIGAWDSAKRSSLYKEGSASAASLQRNDIGLGAVFGFEFDFGMQVSMSYKVGFLNMLNSANDASMRSQMFSIGLGFIIG